LNGLSECQKDNKRARRTDISITSMNHFVNIKILWPLNRLCPLSHTEPTRHTRQRCRDHHLRLYCQLQLPCKPDCYNNLHISRITPVPNSPHYIKPEFVCYSTSPKRTDLGDVPSVGLWLQDTGGRWFAVRERRSRPRQLQRGNASRTVSQTSRRVSRPMQRQDLANPRWRRETQ